METMKIGKDFIDFYQGKDTFYELSLLYIRTQANVNQWCDHMSRKRWFMEQNMLDDFRQALDNWLSCNDARQSRARRHI